MIQIADQIKSNQIKCFNHPTFSVFETERRKSQWKPKFDGCRLTLLDQTEQWRNKFQRWEKIIVMHLTEYELLETGWSYELLHQPMRRKKMISWMPDSRAQLREPSGDWTLQSLTPSFACSIFRSEIMVVK